MIADLSYLARIILFQLSRVDASIQPCGQAVRQQSAYAILMHKGFPEPMVSWHACLPMKIFFTALATVLFALNGFCAEVADQILLNGKILTVDAEDSIVDSIAIRGDRILATGASGEIQKLRGVDTVVIDLDGKCVIPGLTETHCHSIGVARASLGTPYEDYSDIAGMQAVIRKIAKETPAGKWIRAPRVEITRLTERRHPTTAELDAACDTHPVIFTASRKSALNSPALELLGFTDDVAPSSVEIVRDSEGGIRLLGNGLSLLLVKNIENVSPPEGELLAAMQRVHGIYNSVGITSIFERASDRSGWNLFSKLRDNDQLSVRTTMTFRRQMNTAEKVRQFTEELRLKPRQGDDWLRAGPLKITVDGGIHWGNTYLSEPFGSRRNAFYALPDDPEYRGDIRYSLDEMTKVFAEGHRLGWQMSCHVTGDAGVDRVLQALEGAGPEIPTKRMRFNLIHAYFPTASAAARAKKLGLSVDTQSYTYFMDADFISKVYGPEWAERLIGLGEWVRAGVPVSPNSDHMVGLDPDRAMNSFNPFLMLYIAVSRKDQFGKIHGEHQKLTRPEALRTLTMYAAWQSFDEQSRGSLESGKLADLVILDRDYLNCPEEEIREIKPILTMVGGKPAYRIKSSAGSLK